MHGWLHQPAKRSNVIGKDFEGYCFHDVLSVSATLTLSEPGAVATGSSAILDSAGLINSRKKVPVQLEQGFSFTPPL